MNSETTQEIVEEEEALDTGPGHLLSNKREALGLSVQEVADRLHITMHYVRALETDAHDKLPGDVFIRGYLRSYSNLLGLEPSIVINVFNDYTNQRESDELEFGSRRRRQRNKNLPWIIVSGVAFVAMAVALWYFGTASSQTPQAVGARTATATSSARSVNNTNANIAEIATTREVPSVPQASAAPVPAPVVVEPTPESDEQQEDIALAPEMPAIEADSFEETAVIAEDLVEDAAPEQLNSVPEPVQLLDTMPAATVAERIITIEGDGDDTVQIRFTGESMVQVDDANDVQLYRDVRVAGDVLRINGTAPFNVLLGDASNSELSLNGTEIDFSSSIRIDNSARLTIGL